MQCNLSSSKDSCNHPFCSPGPSVFPLPYIRINLGSFILIIIHLFAKLAKSKEDNGNKACLENKQTCTFVALHASRKGNEQTHAVSPVKLNELKISMIHIIRHVCFLFWLILYLEHGTDVCHCIASSLIAICAEHGLWFARPSLTTHLNGKLFCASMQGCQAWSNYQTVSLDDHIFNVCILHIYCSRTCLFRLHTTSTCFAVRPSTELSLIWK